MRRLLHETLPTDAEAAPSASVTGKDDCPAWPTPIPSSISHDPSVLRWSELSQRLPLFTWSYNHKYRLAAPFTHISLTHPSQAVFSILDHSLRRAPDQERVIGTLLGTRSEDDSTIEIRSCFAVGHTETTDQVEVDMEYQKQMLALHLRANPKEVLVGWYATSAELNTFSALIQNFYGGQGDGTWPHPAVHLTVSTVPGKEIEARTYISAPVGVTAERAADSAAFIPVPYDIRYGEAEKSGLELITGARDREDRTANIETDIDSLERAIEETLSMLDRVAQYVESVMEEETPPSTALGQFLLNALALAPKVDPADIERDLYVDQKCVRSILAPCH